MSKELLIQGTGNSQNIKTFLVGIDKIESINENSNQYIFDGVELKWFEINKHENVKDVYKKMLPHLFVVELNEEEHNKVTRFLENPKSSRWMVLNIISEKNQYAINQYIDNNEVLEETKRYMYSLEGLPEDEGIAISLETFFSWKSFPESVTSKDKITQVLNVGLNTDIILNVYNVGQGSLSAVCNMCNVPLVYFDLGGGWAFNHFTYPITKRLCSTITSTIILSHWDWDHLETARRYKYTTLGFFNDKNWIVPSQPLTASYASFISFIIAQNSNLFCWPNNLANLNFGGIEVIKCNGPDKNHSGLALVVNTNPNNNPRNKIISPVLHPADAAYCYIPGINGIEGLVATHHGANFPNSNVPVPNPINNGYIAYSYGQQNTYQHPRQTAVTSHNIAGWTNCLDTINGNISFARNAAPVPVPCQILCDLEVDQSF